MTVRGTIYVLCFCIPAVPERPGVGNFWQWRNQKTKWRRWFYKKTVGFLPEEASKAGLKTVCTRCKRLEGTQEAREVGIECWSPEQGTLGPPGRTPKGLLKDGLPGGTLSFPLV